DDLKESFETVQLRSGPAAPPQPVGVRYGPTDLTRFGADPDRFYETEYDTTLTSMINAILDAEAPLREDVMLQRIARVHGWLRTGARIRERILSRLNDADRVS